MVFVEYVESPTISRIRWRSIDQFQNGRPSDLPACQCSGRDSTCNRATNNFGTPSMSIKIIRMPFEISVVLNGGGTMVDDVRISLNEKSMDSYQDHFQFALIEID